MAGALALAVVLAVASLHAEAVWLDVPQSGTKCASEEIQSNVVVLTDYSIMYESHPYSHPTIAVKLQQSEQLALIRSEQLLHHMGTPCITVRMLQLGNLHSQPQKLETMAACFWVDSAEKGSGVSVNLDWKIGIATKDWDAIAKKEKN